MVQEEMSFKDISYLELWRPLCSVEQNHLCNFGRRLHEEQFCEIILNSNQWFRRRSCLKIFLIWSSGSHFVQPSRTICAILVEGIMKTQFCEIILHLDQWFRRRCVLKIFLIWSSGDHFVQPSGTICAILVEGIMRNNSKFL